MSGIISPREAISTIRQYIAKPPKKPGKEKFTLASAIHKLLVQSEQIITDVELFDDVLKVTDEITAFKGRGN